MSLSVGTRLGPVWVFNSLAELRRIARVATTAD